MQQTMTFDLPPLSEAQPAANAFVATLAPTTSTTALAARHETEAASADTSVGVIEITPMRAHLQRLRFTQAVCENQTGQPSLLTVADAQLALRGREHYFAPLFERYQLSLAQVRETLLWAEDEYDGTLLVEDIIQALVARLVEEQYLRRRQARGRDT